MSESAYPSRCSIPARSIAEYPNDANGRAPWSPVGSTARHQQPTNFGVMLLQPGAGCPDVVNNSLIVRACPVKLLNKFQVFDVRLGSCVDGA
jgi:hypothetical protein